MEDLTYPYQTGYRYGNGIPEKLDSGGLTNYRSDKHFSNGTFRKDLIGKLSNEELVINDDGMKRFCELSINILNKHAPRKKKYARGNQMPFFTKQLSKEIMTRSRLRNKYLRNKNEDNRALYVKQRNYCVSLLRKSKKKYYENLDERNLIDNKLFWKTIKRSFSDKIVTRDGIHLLKMVKLPKLNWKLQRLSITFLEM